MSKGRSSAARRRRQANIRMFYALAAVAAAVIILLLCMTVFFNVTNVRVEGVTVYRKEQIINVGGIVKEMNLVRTDVNKAKQRLLDNLVYIDDVEIRKAYPSTVIISCTEAVKAADIEFEGEYYVLSESGKILESANKKPTGGIPVITGFVFYEGDDIAKKEHRELTDEEKRAFRAPGQKLRSADTYSDKIVTDIIAEMKEQGYKNVRSVDVSSRADIVINVDDKIEIKLGSSADTAYKLGYFKAVMDKLAVDYEGVLIYNGSDNGVSAIPKDKAPEKSPLGDNSDNSSDESSQAEGDAQQAWAAGGDNVNTDDQQWQDGGWTDWDNDDGWTDWGYDGGQTDWGYDYGVDQGNDYGYGYDYDYGYNDYGYGW